MKNPPKRRSVVGFFFFLFFAKKAGTDFQRGNELRVRGQWTRRLHRRVSVVGWLVQERERERERAEQRGVTLRWLLPPKKRSCLNSYLACCAPFLLILMNHWSTFLADADGSSFPPPPLPLSLPFFLSFLLTQPYELSVYFGKDDCFDMFAGRCVLCVPTQSSSVLLGLYPLIVICCNIDFAVSTHFRLAE